MSKPRRSLPCGATVPGGRPHVAAGDGRLASGRFAQTRIALRLDQRCSWQANLLALGATAVIFAFCFALEGPPGGEALLFVFLLPITASACFGGLRAGLVATVASCFAASYFLMPPTHTFAVSVRAHRWQLGFVALAGVFISVLNEALHRMRAQLEEAAREQRETDRGRRETEERWRAYAEQAAECLFVHDPAGRLLDVNPQACASLGYSREELLRLNLFQVESAFDLPLAREAWSHLAPGQPLVLAGRHRRKDGSSFPVEARLGCFGPEGQRGFFVMARDVTERQAHELEIKRLSRLYAALRQINQAIVRTQQRDDLFREICRVLVEDGEFRMAWIGWHDPVGRALLPVAAWGNDQGFLRDLRVFLDGRPGSGGPVETAFAEQRPCIVNDVLHDPAARPWLPRLEPLGIRAVAVFPIRKNGQVLGTMVVYADAPHFFQDKEIALLTEAAENVSFALDNFERHEAENRAAEQGSRLAAIVESSDDAIVGKNLNGIVTSWNAGAEKLFGYAAAEMIGESIMRLIPPERHGEEATILSQICRGETVRHFETVRRRKDGRTIAVSVTVSAIKDRRGKIVGVSKLARDITEQKMAADQLKRGAAGLANAQRLSRIGSWELEIATGALSWSEEVRQIFGLDRAGPGAGYEEFTALVHPEDRARVQAAQQAAWAGEARFDLEHRIVRPDGTERIVHALADLIRDPAGQPAHLAGTVQDITERVQAEAELRETNETFSASFRASPLAMIITTMDGCFVEVNQAYCECIGYAREEILGRTATELGIMMPGAREGYVSTLEQAGGSLSGLEAEVTRRDGTLCTLVMGIREITLRGRRHRLTTAVDVSEQRRTQRALHESETRYRRLFETAKDGIMILDAATGTVVDANPHLITILGVPEDQFLDKPIWESGFFKEVVSDADTFDKLRAKDYLRVPHLPLETGAGTRLEVEFIGSVYEVNERKVIQCSVRDVTARRQAELALRQLNATLEQRVIERTAQLKAANRELEAHSSAISHDLRVAEASDKLKSAFFATMSHELRTPLNSIIGFTGIVLQGIAGPLNAEQTKQLGMVRGSARHLLELINDVLDLSKIEAGQLEVRAAPFNLREAINRVIASVHPQADQKDLKCTAILPPELGEMVSDRRRVEQILLNLLNNAIKFTDHGRVTLTVEMVPALPPSPHAAARPPAVRLRVDDTGIGIAPENLGTLFQPFRQIGSGLTRQSEGTGLGLAICHRLAALLDGEISVNSEWGRGSEFTVTLPLQKRP